MQGLLRAVFSIILTFSFSAFSADGPTASYITAEQVKELQYHELLKLRDRQTRGRYNIGVITQRNTNKDIKLGAITEISIVQTEGNMATLQMAFQAEIMRLGEKVEPSETVFKTLLDGIANIGCRYPHRYIESLTELREVFREQFKDVEYHKSILERIDEVLTSMMSREETLIDLEALIAERQVIEFDPEIRLKRAQEMLSHSIKGQPELIQALLDMEWRSALYGKKRELPDMVYLMGLPGTGKDTAAEAFADALNGYEGAWQEHLFRLPIMREQSDLWKVNGSATGYLGSESFPKFLEFLVLHSDGKYILQRVPGDKPSFRIVLNPSYQGQTLPGYFPPSTGIVFANEFHNWAKSIKDEFLKQALEKGIFTVNNQNGGLAEIQVPIRFVVASNEGVSLIAARDTSGQRVGEAMSYEQLLYRWQSVHANKAALRQEILAQNARPEAKTSSPSKPGISEEFMNRIQDRFLILLRPLAPEHLREIADQRMVKLASVLEDSPLLGQVKLTWSSEITAFLQIYDYIAEENARPIQGRVEALIESPLLDAVRDGELGKFDGQELALDLRINPDGSHSLIIHVTRGEEKFTLEKLMRVTTKDILRDPISDERIGELSQIEERLRTKVFGIDYILRRLSESAISIENDSAGGVERRANVIMLNGLSSTGKTETAKQYAQIINDSNTPLKTFDFSQIRTLHDFKMKILGSKDANGTPIPSEFMQEYDRNNGRLVVAFDELANVRDLELLTTLYDFFREEVMRTFSDGKPRAMGGVTVIVTGNPGQEMYAGVPRDIPMEIQMLAWEEIYRRTADDFELQRAILERYYPQPLITRIGRSNIFFVPPHSYKSLKQLAQLKLSEALERIADQHSRRGWNVVFPSTEEYTKFITMVVDEGFNLREQGQSIDTFVISEFEKPLNALLLTHLVPPGTNVVLRYRETTDNSVRIEPGQVIYDVFVDGRASPLELKVRRPFIEKPMAVNRTRVVVTGYHEAGHSLVRQALFRDNYYGTELSVIPGVDIFGDQWLYYLGVSASEQRREISTSRDWAVRQIAILLAGETAERMVTRGAVHSAGKSNDVARASKMALDAIVRYGLSEAWGVAAVPSGMEMTEYLASLSERQKQLLEDEIGKLLAEGRQLAEDVILANYTTAFTPLAVELLQKGRMKKSDLESFYGHRRLVDPTQTSAIKRAYLRTKGQFHQWLNPAHGGAEVELKPGVAVPETIADLQSIAAAKKAEQFGSVPLPGTLPLGTNLAYAKASGATLPQDCESLVVARK